MARCIHTVDLMKVVLGCGKFDGLQELFTWYMVHITLHCIIYSHIKS